MGTQYEKARAFLNMHQSASPLTLYNVWDAAGAQALVEAGAKAIATSSWSMAAAYGYEDGENIPLDFLVKLIERICASVSVPVSVDFEGGYGTEPEQVAQNVRRVIRAGAVGINFEDRVVNGSELYPIDVHCERIRAVKSIARDENIPLVLNARTDLFLGTDPQTHEACLSEALKREQAYKQAGADCFFVPGLTQRTLIMRLVDGAHLPINIMTMGQLEKG